MIFFFFGKTFRVLSLAQTSWLYYTNVCIVRKSLRKSSRPTIGIVQQQQPPNQYNQNRYNIIHRHPYKVNYYKLFNGRIRDDFYENRCVFVPNDRVHVMWKYIQQR